MGIHFSRAAFEVVPALFFLLAGSYLFLQFVDRKKYPYLIVSACFFVFTLYTYNTCRVLAPLLFISLLGFYYKKLSYKKISFWLSFLPALFLLLPFFWQVFFGAGFSSVKGTLLFASAPIQAQFLEIREMMFAHDPLFSRVFFNRWVLTAYEYSKHIVMYFSPTFFFVSGSEHGNHGIGNVGMFYLFEVITVLVGFVAYCKKSQRWLTFLLSWGVCVILVAAFTREAPHGTRGFFLIPTIVAFSAYGLFLINAFLLKKKLAGRLLLLGMLILIGFNLTYYFSSYYFRFPLVSGKAWRSQDAALVDYLRNHQSKYDHIMIDSKTGFMYTSVLYYLPYRPALFQQTVNRGPDDSEGFSKVHSFGKYQIGDIDWKKLKKQHKTLVVTIPNNVPLKTRIVQEFVFPYRPLLIAQGQEVIRPPVKDTAYVIILVK